MQHPTPSTYRFTSSSAIVNDACVILMVDGVHPPRVKRTILHHLGLLLQANYTPLFAQSCICSYTSMQDCVCVPCSLRSDLVVQQCNVFMCLDVLCRASHSAATMRYSRWRCLVVVVVKAILCSFPMHQMGKQEQGLQSASIRRAGFITMSFIWTVSNRCRAVGHVFVGLSR